MPFSREWKKNSLHFLVDAYDEKEKVAEGEHKRVIVSKERFFRRWRRRGRMIPISLCWDTRKRSVLLKWNGLISSGWQDGKIRMKVLGLPIPLPLGRKGIHRFGKLPIRWVYLKEMFSFLSKMEAQEGGGTFSFRTRWSTEYFTDG